MSRESVAEALIRFNIERAKWWGLGLATSLGGQEGPDPLTGHDWEHLYPREGSISYWKCRECGFSTQNSHAIPCNEKRPDSVWSDDDSERNRERLLLPHDPGYSDVNREKRDLPSCRSYIVQQILER